MAIFTKDLSKKYGDQVALDKVSIDLKKGKIIGLNIVELAPKNDINQISMIVVGRLILKCLMLELSKHS